MDRESGRSRKLAQALIVGAFVCILWPPTEALAQAHAAPAATASGAVPAETATQSHRDRRRAAQQQAATSAKEQTATATAKVDTDTDAAATAATDEPAMVCKSIKPLGTRVAKRVCGTPEQWAAFEKKTTDAASDDMRQVRGTDGVIATTPGTTGP
ncbi:MAG TPA: hypothetical protein VN818_07260 [Gammaproteobacteria bacterium]|nr:hypothetical protein [Gammaproteobacteria bacterium]